MTRQNNPLLSYAKNVFSQNGEDGVIERILELIPETSRWCVELGAWDGKHLSNTHHLMIHRGWSGVFIEGNPVKANELKRTYADNAGATCITTLASFDGDNALDVILSKTKIPKQFGILCIDIDGNDYHVWDSLKKYNPVIVVIEFNPSIPAHIEFVQPKDMGVNQGSSLASLTALGRTKGYELIATTSHNAFFVLEKFYSRFSLVNNTPEALKDRRLEIDIFQLYDGTIVMRGAPRMLWHGIHIRPKDVQMIPFYFRQYPGSMGHWRFFMFRAWRKFRVLREKIFNARHR